MRDSDKRYRFICRSGRNIEVVFSHMPSKRISTGTRDMVEAIKFAEAYLASDGLSRGSAPIFKDFAASFYKRTDKNSIRMRDRAFGREKRDNWYRDNQRFLDNYIMPRFGAYQVDSITTVAIENWVISFKGKDVADLSANSRAKVLNCLSLVLDDVVRGGWLQINPADKVVAPSQHSKERRPLTIWEQSVVFPDDDEERIAIWGGAMWASYFSVMYDTGFRPNEVAGLRLSDVYQTPQGMAVYTTHSMNSEERKPKDRVKTTGKGMESRVGLLSSTTAAILQRLIESESICKAEEFLFLVYRKRKESYVFTPTSNKHFKEVCERYGIDGVTQYSLRHTYATYRRGNMDEGVLSLTMGHKNGVRDDYDHRTASMLIRQVEANRSKLFQKENVEEIQPISILYAK